MYKNQFILLTKARFFPLFMTQFLGAFNDNLFKNALVVLITYIITQKLIIQQQIMVTLAGCLLIIPMFLFSATAGAVADKFEKSRLIKIIKMAEVILMLAAGVGFLFQNVYLLMAILFCLGIQVTFFGPIKYSILPTHLQKDELIGGNGLIEIGTFLAILLGNILGVVFITMPNGLYVISGIIILMAILGFLSSCFIPKAEAPAPDLKLSYNFVKDTMDVIRFSAKSTDIFLSILGISWFWLIGFTFLAQFPSYAKDFIGGNEQIFILFLAIFSIGVGIGSGLCNRLLKGQIAATYVPLAALGMTIFTIDLYFATKMVKPPHSHHLLTLAQFMHGFLHWRIMLDMLCIAISGGIYIVPLYVILQDRSQETHKARIIASNNIMNALFMTFAAIATMIMLKLQLTIPEIFLTIGVVNLLVVIQSCRLLPGALIKSIFQLVFGAFYRVEIKGFENFKLAGDRVVIAPNHTSFIDAILLATFLPGRLNFAIYSGYINKWWIKPIKLFIDLYSIEPTNPYAIKTMIKYLKENHKMVIFPEGRITVTGTLMKIYEGPGMIADKAGAKILPVLIEGAQYTPFSRLRGRVRTRWFPKITITLFEPLNIEVDNNITGRRRRQIIGEQLYKIMSNIMFLGHSMEVSLFQSLLDAKKIYGKHHKIVEDIQRKPLSYQKFLLGCIILGKKLANLSKEGEFVGILLPNLSVTAISFFGLLAYQRVVALLNFSTGILNVVLSCQTANIKLICTSRKFIETARYSALIQALQEKNIRIVYLEDLSCQIHITDKLYALFALSFPRIFGLSNKSIDPNKPAVTLFTSGSEGTPKAVVLSSRNIQANKNQLSSRVDFSPIDIVLNALPMFHSFGLTAGTILPILSGMKVFFYPSPLHYRVVPEVSYDINATILFGTNTFLSGYAKYANPYDFYSIRYVYAGAEKLKEEIRRLWADKFGVRIFEGYGATETSPVISANTPMHNKPSSVGKFMPGIEHKIIPVPDLAEGGVLHVKGPNVMLGYIFANNPGNIIPPPEGWYDTGDIVFIDNDGYIHIKGRAKRFAKIAGEMISLLFVENYLDQLWPGSTHAIVSLADEKKGEQLVLLTTQEKADKSDIINYARANGISELAVPKTIYSIDKIPLLGSGKIDYSAVREWITNRQKH